VTDKCWVLHDGKLENFEAGFSQAELFLEAIHLEEELKKKTIQQPLVTSALNSMVPKLSNKEKNRYDELPSEIEKLESRVSKLKIDIGETDYSSMTKEKKDKLEKLQSDLTKSELKLEGLYNEWATLESKLANS
jgi:polyhydroxyalkanoate synthesis regulator phasin